MAKTKAKSKDEATPLATPGSLWHWPALVLSGLVAACALLFSTSTPSAPSSAATPCAAPLLAACACPGREIPDTSNLYALLGVPSGTTSRDALRKAYRGLLGVWHPDANAGCADAAVVFTELNRAYTALITPQMREVYDREGEAGLRRNFPSFAPGRKR